MYESRKQYVYVPRAHENTQLLRNCGFVREIAHHELAGDHERDYHEQADDQVNPFHNFLQLCHEILVDNNLFSEQNYRAKCWKESITRSRTK